MKCKRWTKEEDLFLSENKNKKIKELSILMGRTIPSIKIRKRLLNLTKTNDWGVDEINFLKENYSKLSRAELLDNLPKRTWSGILGKAKKMGLSRLNFHYGTLRNNNLEILLNESCQTYYFIGLLMADGYFNDREIILSQSIKDYDLVNEFAKYVGCDNVQTNKGVGTLTINGVETKGSDIRKMNICDNIIVPKIKNKFNIIYVKNEKTKTYYPPSVNIFKNMTNDMFISFLIGFIDGDGYISKSVRGGNSIIITTHINWLENLTYWVTKLSDISGVKFSEKCISIEDSIVRVRLYKKEVMMYLKKFINKNNLIVSSRKWIRII